MTENDHIPCHKLKSNPLNKIVNHLFSNPNVPEQLCMFSFSVLAENLRVYLCGTKEEEDPYINATYVHVSC